MKRIYKITIAILSIFIVIEFIALGARHNYFDFIYDLPGIIESVIISISYIIYALMIAISAKAVLLICITILVVIGLLQASNHHIISYKCWGMYTLIIYTLYVILYILIRYFE